VVPRITAWRSAAALRVSAPRLHVEASRDGEFGLLLVELRDCGAGLRLPGRRPQPSNTDTALRNRRHAETT
jgi:hypothetical protein